MAYLPLTVEEMKQQHITQPDFVYVIGDAYIDHPSFGPAIISRVLQSRGYSVCIISQPDCQTGVRSAAADGSFRKISGENIRRRLDSKKKCDTIYSIRIRVLLT